MNQRGKGGAGIRSLAVSFPPEHRTNDYYQAHFPRLVEEVEQRALANLWKVGKQSRISDTFTSTMSPYTADPFRGTQARHVLDPSAGSISIELPAAQSAVAAANLEMKDIDLLLSAAFVPDHFGIGNAVYLARDLGLNCAGWNIETACNSPIAGLTLASALVKSGDFRNILVTLSCNYTCYSPPDDTLGWFLGDGAAAFVVSAEPNGVGLLGQYSVHTAQTIDTFRYAHETTEDGQPVVLIRTSPQTGRILGESSEKYVLECCHGAVRDADVAMEEIDFFVFTTPTAWYAEFCARALGVDRDKTINCYPFIANVGPVLIPANLYYAVKQERITSGSLVLLYGIGSVSSAGATVVRLGDLAIGAGAPDFRPT